jgi:excisionase family DNA binding protein
MLPARFAEERMTYDEVAAALDVTVQTVRNWVSEGKYGFPRGVKVGRHRRFLRSEIDAWLEKRREA